MKKKVLGGLFAVLTIMGTAILYNQTSESKAEQAINLLLENVEAVSQIEHAGEACWNDVRFGDYPLTVICSTPCAMQHCKGSNQNKC